MDGWAGPAKPRGTSIIRVGRTRQRKKRKSMEQCLVEFSQRMKRAPTRAEALLKAELEALGLKFRFQSPRIDRRRGLNAILDFLLPRKVVVEVDGGYHNDPDQQAKDFIRDDALYWAGFKVVRLTNEEVYADPAGAAFRVAWEMGERGYRHHDSWDERDRKANEATAHLRAIVGRE